MRNSLGSENRAAPFQGMLVVNKEAGFTSNDVVAKLRGILHMRKIGHTGTLDPDAVGVLPVCLGNGTKLAELIADRDKEYVAMLRLGVTTDTQDMSGTGLKNVPDEEVLRLVTQEKLAGAIEQFVGEINQIPPMYSAIKVNGQKLYELARAGKTIERKARRITIYEIELLEIRLPLVTMRVRCSKGTYIRTLCEDIGAALGVGGAMQHLTRTRVGTFTLAQALTLSEVQQLMDNDPGGEAVREHVLPVDYFFAGCPSLQAAESAQIKLRNGNVLLPEEVSIDAQKAENANMDSDRNLYRVYDSSGNFCAVYTFDPDTGLYRPRKMFL